MNTELYQNKKWCETRSQFIKDIGEEIDLKLFYLDIIQDLQTTLKFECDKDEDEKIKAMKKIDILEEENSFLLNVSSGFIDISKDADSNTSIGNLLDDNLIIPQGPCIKFSNLFDLSGQFSDFCCGEYGSKFVIDRLERGACPERDYAMKELNLPDNLMCLLENPHSAKVATVLANIEHKGRAKILSFIETHFSDITSKVLGMQLVKRYFKLS